MNSNKLSLKEALAEIPDFRQASGRRYELWVGPLQSLYCVEMFDK
jgi:hypothetical protein